MSRCLPEISMFTTSALMLNNIPCDITPDTHQPSSVRIPYGSPGAPVLQEELIPHYNPALSIKLRHWGPLLAYLSGGHNVYLR